MLVVDEKLCRVTLQHVLQEPLFNEGLFVLNDVCFTIFQSLPSMDGGQTDGVGVVEVSTKDFPSIQAVHSQDTIVADLLQQAAEAGGVVEEQGGVLEQVFFIIKAACYIL